MARRSEHTLDEIRQMVMNAAESIVVQDGFSALKVRRIAMDIGYTVGSIYMVFENMSDLIVHLKAKTLDDLAKHLDLVPPKANIQLMVIDLAKAYLSFARANFNRWSMLFEHKLPNDVTTPEWYLQKTTENISRIEELLRQLTAIDAEPQAKAVATTLWSGIHGICILSLTNEMNATGIAEIEANLLLLVESFLLGWQQSM